MANEKPSCGMALVGMLVILFVLILGIWLVAGPRATKEPEPNWIQEGFDGNHGTICAAVFYRIVLQERDQSPDVREGTKDTAQAFLNLGNGDKERAISLARSGRPIVGERSCANETITDQFKAEEDAVRRTRTP